MLLTQKTHQAIMGEIEEYISKQIPEVQGIIKTIRNLILKDFPKLKEQISWNCLCFKDKNIILSLSPEEGYVRIDFHYGLELEDPESLLQGEVEKLKHIKVADLSLLHREQLNKWIEESIKLNK